MLLLVMTLSTSRKESTSGMSSLKPHKRDRRLNFYRRMLSWQKELKN
jgi:hypothetical protein